jgi:hypothetical protein
MQYFSKQEQLLQKRAKKEKEGRKKNKDKNKGKAVSRQATALADDAMRLENGSDGQVLDIEGQFTI